MSAQLATVSPRRIKAAHRRRRRSASGQSVQRYYDPMCGCFLSVDPVSANSAGGNFNRYWYANANPYRFLDPDGRQTRRIDEGDSDEDKAKALAERDRTSSAGGLGQHSGMDVVWAGVESATGGWTPSQGSVDFWAGAGDMLSFGGSKWAREKGGFDSVDYDSGAYMSGEVTGAVFGLATGGVGGLSGGARTVFWSGAGNMERAASMGISLERTPIGGLMNRYASRMPSWAWKGASAVFAANARGQAIKVGLFEGRVWSSVEKPILQWRGIPFTVVP